MQQATSTKEETFDTARLRLGDTRTPQQIAQEFQQLMQEGMRVAAQTPPRVGITRSLQAARALLLTGVEFAQQFQQRGSPPTIESLQNDAPVILRKLFERLGSTYIKLGQFIASSPTLFPAAYVEEFQKCLDSVEAVPYPEIQRIIAAELQSKGLKTDAVFSFIDPVPLATASIAQVHAAQLRSTGQDVVIKVRKPGVSGVLQADLGFLCFATRALQFLNPNLARLSLADVSDDIRASMLDEVDFRKEARNMEAFRRFLSDARITRAVCPEVIEEASTSAILTMQRLYGKPLVDLAAVREYTGSARPEDSLITALNTWMASVAGCESFHADVHAGNLLILRDGTVGFIDFGIVGRVSPLTWAAVRGLADGLAASDYRKMAAALVGLGATAPGGVDEAGLARDLERLTARVTSLDVEVVLARRGEDVTAAVRADEEDVTRLLLELVEVGQRYGIRFPRDFGLLVKQALYFDRYTKILAPSLDPLQDDRLRASFDRLGSARPASPYRA